MATFLKRLLGMTLLGVACVAMPAVWVQAADTGALRELTVRRADHTAWVSARLSGGLPNRVLKQIRRGVPQDLFYTVTVRRRHRRWFDEELLASTVRFTLRYDTLRGIWLIRRTAPDGAVFDTEAASQEQAVEAVSQLRDVAIEVPPMRRGEWYYISVKAEVRATPLPLYLDYVFFFVPHVEFETPWASSGPLAP
ncbi:MAG: DUF4390 domain-containing protein [Nitrospirota bacterium]|nr:DUF4390 domain-containing protein [Nitrospirota bacterium]